MILRGPRFAAVFLLIVCGLAHGAQIFETFEVNLDPLIDKAMRHRTQFAVNVARHVDSESGGTWRIESNQATWDYAIRIPSSVSVGFHASRLTLPAQGTLTIAGGGQSFTYQRGDLHRADFWSRTLKGDQIAIRISVPKHMRRQALIEIVAFQAGYRSLSPGMPDNPHYSSLKARGADSSGSCIQNYVCDATPATQSSANASAAIVISNQFECSATLVNDVPQDGAPYLLTARHCENGEAGGGDPAAASSIQVYWNATTGCGQPLQSIFDSYSQVQSGATTIVEQQDEWLIRLDSQPAWSSVYYAGWDASGNELVNGYSVEYSNAQSQQYITWAGPAITENLSAQTLGVGYASTYWGVVNSLGSVDHGASGSALFNDSHLLVGSASRAVVEQCPVSPPPTPSSNTVVALYNQLASTWNSIADASSSTGSKTIASVLDPAHTGATVMAGIAGPPPTSAISASQSSAQIGSSVDLQFEGTAGAVCTATGGTPGDGWSGTLNAYPGGNLSVTETSAGNFTYGIKCVSGSRSSSAQVTVIWSLAAPTLTFYDGAFPNGLYVGLVNPLVWQSNQASCAATGGSPGDGWTGSLAGSGQVDLIENSAGTYTYSLTCGTGDQSISRSLSLTFAAPTGSLSVSGMTGLRFGQSIAIVWNGSGDCTASGGGPADGWAGPLTGNFGAVFLTEQTAGSYVYTLSCGPAAIAAVRQATYTFTGGAPFAQLTASLPTQLIDLSVQSYPALLSWTSNVQPCAIDYAGPVNGTDLSGYPSQGTDTEPQGIAGSYSYVLTCGLAAAQAQSTATIQWTQQPVPRVTLTAENGVDEPGNEFLLSTGGYLKWTTNVLPCTGSGGTPGDAWDLTLPYYGGPGNSSALLFSEPKAGTYTFTVTCGVGNVATAQATAVYNNSGGNVLTLAPGSSQVDTGQPTYMTWNSTVGPCTAYGGTSGDGWNGPQPQVGTAAVVEAPGDYTLSLVCGTGSAGVEAQSEIYVGAPPLSVFVTLLPNPPNLTMVEVGHPVTLQWTGNGGAFCTATGGVAGDGWTGTLPWNGTLTVVESQAGSVSYGLICRNGSLSGQDAVTIVWQAAASVRLSASTEQAVLSTPFTLTWSSANGAYDCTASEDGTGAWTGAVSSEGSMSIEETAGTQHTYTLVCASGFGNVQAQVVVKFSPATSGGSGSGGTGTSSASKPSASSGGGNLGIATIGILALLAAMRLFPSVTRRLR